MSQSGSVIGNRSAIRICPASLRRSAERELRRCVGIALRTGSSSAHWESLCTGNCSAKGDLLCHLRLAPQTRSTRPTAKHDATRSALAVSPSTLPIANR